MPLKQKRPNTCSTCNKVFIAPAFLRRHEVIHSATKPYKCNQCGQKFTQNSSLQRHIREKHIGLKAYNCTKCGQSFSQQTNLALHMQRLHPDTPLASVSVQCNRCSCFFKTPGSLRRHETLMHSKKDVNLWDCDEPDILAQQVIEQFKSLQSQLDPPADKGTRNQSKITDNACHDAKENNNLEKIVFDQPDSEIVAITDRLYPDRVQQSLMIQRIRRDNGFFYVCEFCSLEFKKSYDFIRHRRKHTKEKPYKCDKCTKSFITKNKLKLHSKIHIKQKPSVCPNCYKEFSTSKQLKFHMKNMARCIENQRLAGKILTVEEKDNEMDMLESLLPEPIEIPKPLHNQGIDENLSFESFTLNYQYLQDQPDNFILNQQPSHEIIFKCAYCDDKFEARPKCVTHMKEHLRELLETSDENPDTKSNHSQDEQNEDIHSSSSKSEDYFIVNNYKPMHQHPCPHCIRGFQRTTDLERHLRTHTREKPFSCDECSKTFALKSTLKYHLLTHSADRKSFSCQECDRTYSSKTALRLHLRLHSNEKPFTCDDTREKPFSCDQCSKTFTLKSSLKYHFLTHSTDRKSFSCQVCARKYASKTSLKLHLRLHTNEKPFACDDCSKRFRTSGHLLAHLRAHNSCQNKPKKWNLCDS